MCRNCVRSTDDKRTIFLPDQDQPGVVIEPLGMGSETQAILDLLRWRNEMMVSMQTILSGMWIEAVKVPRLDRLL